MFRKGDRVVYPQHGAVVIEDIVERDFDGGRRTYFKLHVSIGDLTLMVPVESIEEVGLREVVSREEVARVFGLLREEEVWLPMSWARRYKANQSMDSVSGQGLRVALPPVDVAPVALGGGKPAHVQAPEDPPDPRGADLHVVVALEVHRDLVGPEVIALAEVDDLAEDLGLGGVRAHMRSP